VESNLRARIAALAEAEPALADDLAVRGALIEIVDHAEPGQMELRLPADIARARLAAGVPLLDRLDLQIPASITALLDRLTVAVLADPAVGQSARAMLTALREHRIHAEQLVGEAIVDHEDHLAALAASADLPRGLVDSVADLAARALLSAVASRLCPALALATWDRGYCPVCGGRSVFGETAVVDVGERTPAEGTLGCSRLRCGRCATSWAHALRRCPDCHDGRLAVIDISDAPDLDGWTLAGCEACRAYLKIAPAPRSKRLGAVLVDDLATWRLDRTALALRYERQTGRGYRLEHGEPVGEELDDD
jgi:formate dehydrogenase maturation protein FdhE